MAKQDRILLPFSLLIMLSLVAGYQYSRTTVTLAIDGASRLERTHRLTVAGLFDEIGFAPTPFDIVTPPITTTLRSGDVITVQRARQVRLVADGRAISWLTHARTVSQALSEAGVLLHERDSVYVNDRLTDSNALLSGQALPGGASHAAFSTMQPVAAAPETSPVALDAPQAAPLVSITIRRAVAVTINDDGAAVNVMTAASTVGEALWREGVYVYAADIVTPPLDTRIAAGAVVSIQRARMATITADGRTFGTRTQAGTVAAMLIEEGIVPQGKDYSTPALQSPVSAGMTVQLTRVREDNITESEGVPFKTVMQPDGNLELDQQRIVTHGKQGVLKRTIRIVYENNKEVQRVVDREWVSEEPTTQVIAYGTKVVVRTTMTADGPIEYWRAFRVWATFYTPLLSGTPLDAPYFGITFTGRRATKGIIAVDPKTIRLHTPMYVPGYGFGAAEDTGNMVVGKVIDLCYDDDDSHPERWSWARWTTVYLLTPVPADIPYVLPDYPREPS